MSSASSNEENKQLVQAFFDRWAAGEIDRACELLHDDLAFWTPIRREEFGKADTPARLGRVGSLMKGGVLPFDVTELVAEDDRVSALVEVDTELADGTPYDQLYHFFFRVRDGRIVQIREYNDTALVYRVGIVPAKP